MTIKPQSTPSVSVALSATPADSKSDAVSTVETKDAKYEPGNGSTALVLVGNEIDLSYIYDTLTIYPKQDAEIPNLDQCFAKCKEQVTGLVRDFFPTEEEIPKTQAIRQHKTATCMIEVTEVKGVEPDRLIHYDDDDHDFYHQDSIDEDRDHAHIKFRRAITQAQFTRMVDIFRSENLITQEQRDGYIAAFAKRNSDAEAAVDALCMKEAKRPDADSQKLADGRAIIQYIGTCQNNDVLLHLHPYLLSAKFDYLRVISETDQHPKAQQKEWQGTNRDGRVVPTSGTWAKLEKAISLQMIENWRRRARNFTPQLGAERSAQMAKLYGFFGIKRSRNLKGPDAVRTYKTLDVFSKADTTKLDVKRKKIFG